MNRAYLLEVARRASGLTQAELAARSGTSQATMSAYERGLKSPTLKVAARILEAAGYDLNLRRLIDWVEHCRAVFGTRGTHAWPPVLTAHGNWDVIYVRALEGFEEVGIAGSVDDALLRVQSFADRIAGARSG